VKLFTNFLYVILQSEVEDTLKRIQSHKGVQGLIVVNCEGGLNVDISFNTWQYHTIIFSSAVLLLGVIALAVQAVSPIRISL